MKTRKWSSLTMAALTALCVWSCQDWGKMDPPAGRDVYPILEQVSAYDFETDLDPVIMQVYTYVDGKTPDLVKDDELKSQVLHLDTGYVRLSNPLNSTKVQNAVSITFLVKQAGPTGQEGEENPFVQDVRSALVSFTDANGGQKLYITTNGGVVYDGVDGELSINTADEALTGLLDEPGEWHYVALSVTNSGYFIYVDGKKRIDQTITNFDCSKLVQFMASVPNIYLGYGNETIPGEWWLDDLKFYRNILTSTETTDPRKPSSGVEDNTNWVIVGSEDNSDGFFAPKSDMIKLKSGETAHWGFYNYTAGTNNWENWILVCTNGPAFGETGYIEHFVLRADAYGWGDGSYSVDNISYDYDWETFTTEMNGAWIDLTVTRTDNTVNMKAVATAADGTVRTYTFKYEGTLEEEIGFFLTLEKAHLKFDPAQVYVTVPGFSPHIVGKEDCSGGFFSAFSECYTLKGDFNDFVLTFTNNNTGSGANWNNWILVMTDGKDSHTNDGKEYFVLRSDAYGWGDSNYSGDNISSSFNWDTYVADMHGAECRIVLSRSGSKVSMKCYQRKADETMMPDYTFHYDNVSSDEVGFFLTIEQASLVVSAVGYYPHLNQIYGE